MAQVVLPPRIGRNSEYQSDVLTLTAGSTLTLTLQPPRGIYLFLKKFSWSGVVLPNVFKLVAHGNRDIAPHEAVLTEDFISLGLPDFTTELPEVSFDDPFSISITNMDTVDRDIQFTAWWIQADEDTAKIIRAWKVRR